MGEGRINKGLLKAAAALSLLALILLAFRMILTDSSRFSFLPGNLALAWAALLSGWLLVHGLKTRAWNSWQNILLTIAWLFFLPNSWYVLTDFVHLFSTGEVSVLYDIVMLATLVFVGFFLGFISLYLVHLEIKKRLNPMRAYQLVEAVLLLSSFAIYLGRVLRWNSWDVLTNPSGLILNVSDRVVDPLGHPSAVNITGLFFIFLSVCYYAFWRTVNELKSSKSGR